MVEVKQLLIMLLNPTTAVYSMRLTRLTIPPEQCKGRKSKVSEAAWNEMRLDCACNIILWQINRNVPFFYIFHVTILNIKSEWKGYQWHITKRNAIYDQVIWQGKQICFRWRSTYKQKHILAEHYPIVRSRCCCSSSKQSARWENALTNTRCHLSHNLFDVSRFHYHPPAHCKNKRKRDVRNLERETFMCRLPRGEGGGG